MFRFFSPPVTSFRPPVTSLKPAIAFFKPSNTTLQYIFGSTATGLAQTGVNYFVNYFAQKNNIKPEVYRMSAYPFTDAPIFKLPNDDDDTSYVYSNRL